MKSHYVLRLRKLKAMLLGAFLAAPLLAGAQPAAYPDRPIHIVVAFAPGGGVDSLTRILGERLGTALKQPVIVDNKPGANANLGADFVAKAAPDGYTFMMASAVLAANSALSKSLPFNPVTDLREVVRIGRAPSVLVVPPALEIQSIDDLIAYSKRNGGKVSFSSSGIGSAPHLNGEILSSGAALDAVHVPYRGGALAMSDLVSGRVTFMIGTPSEVLPFIQSGKLRAIAVTGSTRLESLKDVPTFSEAGLKNVGQTSWWGLVAPAKTPEAIVRKIETATLEVLKDPELRAAVSRLGVEVAPQSAAEFTSFFRAESKRYSDLIKKFDIPVE